MPNNVLFYAYTYICAFTNNTKNRPSSKNQIAAIIITFYNINSILIKKKPEQIINCVCQLWLIRIPSYDNQTLIRDIYLMFYFLTTITAKKINKLYNLTITWPIHECIPYTIFYSIFSVVKEYENLT